MNKRISALILVVALVATSTMVYAAAQQFTLAPGDTLTVSCSTTLGGSVGASSASLTCAPPSPPALVWKVPQVAPLGQSVGYDPGSSLAAEMFRCGGWWSGQDDENTYATVRFPHPTAIYGVRFGSYAWNGTGSVGTTGTMWLRDAGKLTEKGADGGPLWHNNFRTDNELTDDWSLDGQRANVLAPAFPNGPAGLVFQIPWNKTTTYEFRFNPVTVTDLRVELQDEGGGGSFTTLTGGLRILTPPSTPGTAC